MRKSKKAITTFADDRRELLFGILSREKQNDLERRKSPRNCLGDLGGLLTLVSGMDTRKQKCSSDGEDCEGDDDTCDGGINRQHGRAIWSTIDRLSTNRRNGHFSIPLHLHCRLPRVQSFRHRVKGADSVIACLGLQRILSMTRSEGSCTRDSRL